MMNNEQIMRDKEQEESFEFLSQEDKKSIEVILSNATFEHGLTIG